MVYFFPGDVLDSENPAYGDTRHERNQGRKIAAYFSGWGFPSLQCTFRLESDARLQSDLASACQVSCRMGSVIIWSIAAITIWLLWRRSTEPQLGVRVALLVQLALWTPYLFLTLLVPGTSLQVGPPAPVVELKIAGLAIDPQVVFAIIFLLLTAWGYRLASRAVAAQTTQSN